MLRVEEVVYRRVDRAGPIFRTLARENSFRESAVPAQRGERRNGEEEQYQAGVGVGGKKGGGGGSVCVSAMRNYETIGKGRVDTWMVRRL